MSAYTMVAGLVLFVVVYALKWLPSSPGGNKFPLSRSRRNPRR